MLSLKRQESVTVATRYGTQRSNPTGRIKSDWSDTGRVTTSCHLTNDGSLGASAEPAPYTLEFENPDAPMDVEMAKTKERHAVI